MKSGLKEKANVGTFNLQSFWIKELNPHLSDISRWKVYFWLINEWKTGKYLHLIYILKEKCTTWNLVCT